MKKPKMKGKRIDAVIGVIGGDRLMQCPYYEMFAQNINACTLKKGREDIPKDKSTNCCGRLAWCELED